MPAVSDDAGQKVGPSEAAAEAESYERLNLEMEKFQTTRPATTYRLYTTLSPLTVWLLQ